MIDPGVIVIFMVVLAVLVIAMRKLARVAFLLSVALFVLVLIHHLMVFVQ